MLNRKKIFQSAVDWFSDQSGDWAELPEGSSARGRCAVWTQVPAKTWGHHGGRGKSPAGLGPHVRPAFASVLPLLLLCCCWWSLLDENVCLHYRVLVPSDTWGGSACRCINQNSPWTAWTTWLWPIIPTGRLVTRCRIREPESYWMLSRSRRCCRLTSFCPSCSTNIPSQCPPPLPHQTINCGENLQNFQ